MRELQNVIERAVILSRTAGCGSTCRISTAPPVVPREAAKEASAAVLTDDELRSFERANISAALKTTGGKVFGQGGAAELLGIKPTTLALAHQGAEDRAN